MAEKRSRRRGKGSLQTYQTKAGERWRFQIWIPIDPENPELGEKKYSRAGFKTMSEAQDELDLALMKRKQDERFHGKTPTFKQYGQEWLDSLNVQASTLQGYQRQFDNYLAPHLGSKPIDKITAPTIGKLYKQLKTSGGKDGAPLSANTVNKVSIELAAILDSALEDGFIVKNPARIKKVTRPPASREIRAERPELATWSATELNQFLEWCKDTYKDEYYELWLTLARTGMRRGEVVALQWKDLDLKRNQIAIRRAADPAVKHGLKVPKSGIARVIDVDSALVKALTNHRAQRATLSLDYARPEAFIFGDVNGKMRNPLNVSKRWSTRIRQAQVVLPDLPKIQLHGLRHTHATLLLELGESPKVVQERLGHSSIAITMDIYSHVSPTMQRAAVDRFSALLDGS